MNDEFFDLIDEEILDEYLENQTGHAAREEVDLGTTSKAELELLITGLIDAYNECLETGHTSMAAVLYRHIQQFKEADEEIAEMFEESQQIDPMQALFGNSGAGEEHR